MTEDPFLAGLVPEFQADPVYDDRLLAFVDVLGWSKLIEKSVADESAMAIIEAGAVAMATLRNTAMRANQNSAAIEPADRPVIQASFFSDTFVLSVSCNDAGGAVLTALVETLCSSLLIAGRYTRGAIVRGPLRHTEAMIYGPALVDAHKIEKCIAKYPRVIVSNDVEPFLRLLPPRVDTDGLLYFDFLRPFRAVPEEIKKLEITLELIARYTHESQGDEKLLAKHEWFRRYVEATLAETRGRQST